MFTTRHLLTMAAPSRSDRSRKNNGQSTGPKHVVDAYDNTACFCVHFSLNSYANRAPSAHRAEHMVAAPNRETLATYLRTHELIEE